MHDIDVHERRTHGFAYWTGAASIAAVALFTLSGCTQAPTTQSATTAAAKAAAVGPETTICNRPVYPPEAVANKLEGTVTIGFLIGTDGHVRDSKIYQTSGHASLDEAARSGIMKCRFKPPIHEGKAVQAWVPVQYVWTME